MSDFKLLLARRAFTIYYNSDYDKCGPRLNVEEALQKDGILPADFASNKIDIQGEQPEWTKGNTIYSFENVCPEVNLFDSMNSLVKEKACTSAVYDKLDSYQDFKILKNKHYSECTEFNWYLFKKNNLRSNSTLKRKHISPKIKSILQKEINSECPICKNQDVEHFHIHHIDENPKNNDAHNLLMLCPTCHSKITKGDISQSQVKTIKEKLSL
jgi:hypothetical protein